MPLTDYADQYTRARGICRTPVYSAKRFAAVVGDVAPESITQAHVEQFVAMAREAEMPAWTIRGTLKDIRTLVRAASGAPLKLDVKAPQPDPQPCEVADIDALWSDLAPWAQQWCVLAYWTCLRLDDSISLQLEVSPAARLLTWTASKTGWTHRYPIAAWLRPWLTARRLPYRAANDHAQVLLRSELARCCTRAGVPLVKPSNIRDRAITEWSKASPDAGAIIHGCGLGTRKFYVPPHEILEAAMDRVRFPVGFGATVADSDGLLAAFHRMDPAGQRLIRETAQRLASG